MTDQVGRHREILLPRQSHHAGVVAGLHLQEDGGVSTINNEIYLSDLDGSFV